MTDGKNFKIGLTVFKKHGGEPLSKSIARDGDTLVSDSSTCLMGRGEALHVELDDLAALGGLIHTMPSDEAITLGIIRIDARPPAGQKCRVTTKWDLETRGRSNGTIARSNEFMRRPQDVPGGFLFDYDKKYLSAQTLARIEKAGGFIEALKEAIPELADVGMLVRASTSSGIVGDDGFQFPSSGGQHVFILLADGNDAERLMKVLSKRLWLAGLGWHDLSKSGAFLNHTLIDLTVWSGTRLVFEGAPKLGPGLRQERAAPVLLEGDILDSKTRFPDLSAADEARYEEMITASKRALKPEFERVKAAIIERETDEIVAKTKEPRETLRARVAERVRQRLEEHVLTSDFRLLCDDPEIGEGGWITVADVLDDPDRYMDETIHDPLEPDYGSCKARIYWAYDDNGIIVHSFAHGGAKYRLRHDAEAIAEMMAAEPERTVLKRFADMMVRSDGAVSPGEREDLVKQVMKRAGIKGKRPVNAALKDAATAYEKAGRQRRKLKEQAEKEASGDRRPELPVPEYDAELDETVRMLDDILLKSTRPEPPMRNFDGRLVEASEKEMPIGLLHLLQPDHVTSAERMKAPNQVVLHVLNDNDVARLVEQEVRFVKIEKNGRRYVALPPRHCGVLAEVTDSNLPKVLGVQTLPLVLPERRLLVKEGLDREMQLIFRIDPALAAAMPKPQDCTLAAAREAYRFLTDDVLGDVATTPEGKMIIIAQMMTIVERHLLSNRPVFFIVADQAEAGKTTACNMVSVVAVGTQAAAAAWSKSDEERRKTLHALSLENPSLAMWDNIVRGSSINCQHIERASTSLSAADRTLGESRRDTGMLTTIHCFTGNGVKPKGDLATRSLVAKLATDRADPANRPFKHPKIIEWAEENRARILAALYTVLLVERAELGERRETRFKVWWELVGYPLEVVSGIRFKNLFDESKGKDDIAEGIASYLVAWWGCFSDRTVRSTEIVETMYESNIIGINGKTREAPLTLKERAAREALRDAFKVATSETGDDEEAGKAAQNRFRDVERLDKRAIGKRLMKHVVGVAVAVNGVELQLQCNESERKQGNTYKLNILKGDPAMLTRAADGAAEAEMPEGDHGDVA